MCAPASFGSKQVYYFEYCKCRYIGHLHVGMTSIQNSGYFWLKTNYRVYLCCLEFLSGINHPSFYLGHKALPRSPLKSPKSLVRRRKSRWRLSRRRCRSSLPQRFSTFQPSRNDQAIFLSLKIPLVRLTDVSKVGKTEIVGHANSSSSFFLLSVSLVPS